MYEVYYQRVHKVGGNHHDWTRIENRERRGMERDKRRRKREREREREREGEREPCPIVTLGQPLLLLDTFLNKALPPLHQSIIITQSIFGNLHIVSFGNQLIPFSRT